MGVRRAATLVAALLLAAAALRPASAQSIPKASPTTPVQSVKLPAPGDPYPGAAWERRAPPPAVDTARLLVTAESAFSDPPPAELPGTRALLIVHRGALVYERYAEGFSAASRFPSWSMANALVGAGVGILAGDGKIALDAPAGVPAWQGAKDPRRAISVRQLLTMTSGIDWPGAPQVPPAEAADVQMLFGRGRHDMAAFAAARRLADPPGSRFQYNTGSSVLLGALLARTVAPDASGAARRRAARRFYDERLFTPLGITSAVLEFDRSGTLAGGAYAHMTAQDYARLGYLYARGGEWKGVPILPAGWIEETRKGAQNSSAYGALFGLMTRKAGGPAPALVGDPTALLASGDNGQAILIVPSRGLVIVRLGHSPASAWPAIHAFLRDLIAAFPPG